MKDLGSLGGTCTLARSEQPRSSRRCFQSGRRRQAARLSVGTRLKQDLDGSLGGDYTGAYAINDVGEAVGYAYLSRRHHFSRNSVDTSGEHD